MYVVVCGKFECNYLCERFRHIWEDNIKMDLERGQGASAGFIWHRVGTSGGYNLNMVMFLLFSIRRKVFHD